MIERSTIRSALTPKLCNLSEDTVSITEIPPSTSSFATVSKNGESSASKEPFATSTKVTKLTDRIAIPGLIDNFDHDS